MEKIIEVCKRESIPFVASFQYATDDEDNADVCSSTIPGESPGPGMRALRKLLLRQADGSADFAAFTVIAKEPT